MSDNVERTCEQCGCVIVKTVRETRGRTRGRRFCSHVCANRARIKPEKPHAPCANPSCGGPVPRRDGEGYSKYHSRQCCSAECAREMNCQGAADWFAAQRGAPRGWPELTGSNLRGRPFAAFDCDPGDGGLLLVSPQITFVSTEANS